MYKQTLWLDHSVTPDRTFKVTENADGTITLVPTGTVIQQGTNMSAANFNNIEFGVQDADLMHRLMLMVVRRDADRLEVAEADIDDIVLEFTPEEQTITLTNTASYPFNNSEVTVSLATKRTTLNYVVEYEVTDSDGNYGEIEISDKQLNGFKIGFTGSATSVTVKIKIRGGYIV